MYLHTFHLDSFLYRILFWCLWRWLTFGGLPLSTDPALLILLISGLVSFKKQREREYRREGAWWENRRQGSLFTSNTAWASEATQHLSYIFITKTSRRQRCKGCRDAALSSRSCVLEYNEPATSQTKTLIQHPTDLQGNSCSSFGAVGHVKSRCFDLSSNTNADGTFYRISSNEAATEFLLGFSNGDQDLPTRMTQKTKSLVIANRNAFIWTFWRMLWKES